MSRTSIALCLCLCACFIMTAAAQEPSAKLTFKLKRTPIEGLAYSNGLRELVTNGPNRAVGFFTDEVASPLSMRLHRVSFDANGIPGDRTQLTAVPKGIVSDPAAFWFAEEDQGILAYGFINAAGEFWLSVQPFDGNGNPVLTETRHFGVKPATGETFQSMDVTACTVGSDILFCAAVVYRQSEPDYTGITRTRLYTIMVNRYGQPVGPVAQPTLPASGILKEVLLTAPPIQFGADVLLPLTVTKHAFGETVNGITYGKTIGTDIYVSVVRVANGEVSLIHRLYASNNIPNYGTVMLVEGFMAPPAAASGVAEAPKNMGLIYLTGRHEPKPFEKMRTFAVTHLLQKVDRKGRKVGAPIVLQIPEWNHLLPYSTTKVPQTTDFLSVPFHHEGNYWLTVQTLSLYRTQYMPVLNRDFEELFRLISIDGATGRVEVLVERRATLPLIFGYSCLARQIGGNYLIGHNSFSFNSSGGYIPYFSPMRVTSVRP